MEKLAEPVLYWTQGVYNTTYRVSGIKVTGYWVPVSFFTVCVTVGAQMYFHDYKYVAHLQLGENRGFNEYNQHSSMSITLSTSHPTMIYFAMSLNKEKEAK